MTDALARLAAGARRILGRDLTGPETEMYYKYMILLVKWQKNERLVGSSNPLWIVDHLILDSLLFLRVLPDRIGSLLDLGSGAGLPGIPIKVVKAEVSVTFVESRRRRASFLASVVRELRLESARVLNVRAEAVVDEIAGRFDAVVMRCAGRIDDLLPMAARLLGPGGIAIASGPPTRRPLARGGWIEVAGIEPGKSRRFVVLRRS